VFFGEIYPPASLKPKWLTQRTEVRFRRHFTFALLRKKFLGEKSGLSTCHWYQSGIILIVLPKPLRRLMEVVFPNHISNRGYFKKNKNLSQTLPAVLQTAL
jgi:hypothetical protein